ncbi:MAG: hypothetical protein ACRD0Z_16575 [Acidimicrobiales bacterium]
MGEGKAVRSSRRARMATLVVVVLAAVLTLGWASPATAATRNAKAPSCGKYTGASLTGFISAAESAFPVEECLYPLRQRITVAAGLTVSSPAILDFDGAKLSGGPGLTTSMIVVEPSAADSAVTDVTLSKGPKNGLQCSGTCSVTQTTIEGFEDDGLYVSGNDESVIGGKTANSQVSTIGDGIGLLVNEAIGVTIGYFSSSYDNHYGALLQSVTGTTATACTATSIKTEDTGKATATWSWGVNDAGSGLQLKGTSGCRFASVKASSQGGYGIALGNSSDNVFGTVAITGESHGQLNPGINLSHSAAGNVFKTVNVVHKSVAVDVGNDGVAGGGGTSGNDDNVFENLSAKDDTYGVIDFHGGTGNRFGSVTSTDDGSPNGFYIALVLFKQSTSPVTGNVVTSATFTGSPAAPHDTPDYLVYADSGSSGNSVTIAKDASTTYKLAPCEDLNGGNSFSGCDPGAATG